MISLDYIRGLCQAANFSLMRGCINYIINQKHPKGCLLSLLAHTHGIHADEGEEPEEWKTRIGCALGVSYDYIASLEAGFEGYEDMYVYNCKIDPEAYELGGIVAEWNGYQHESQT